MESGEGRPVAGQWSKERTRTTCGWSVDKAGQRQVGKVGRQVGGGRRQLDTVRREQELSGVRRQSGHDEAGQCGVWSGRQLSDVR